MGEIHEKMMPFCQEWLMSEPEPSKKFNKRLVPSARQAKHALEDLSELVGKCNLNKGSSIDDIDHVVRDWNAQWRYFRKIQSNDYDWEKKTHKQLLETSYRDVVKKMPRQSVIRRVSTQPSNLRR